MMNQRRTRFPLGAVASAFGVILVVSIVAYGTFWLLDFAEVLQAPGPFELMLDTQAGEALSGMGEIIVAVLGIALTVAAIIVELASQRYTPRIADLFPSLVTAIILHGTYNAAVVGLERLYPWIFK